MNWLRARDDIVELRAGDLRFSLKEIQSFFQQPLQLPLSTEVIARLETRTEGWAAGLQLVALALQGRQEPQQVEQFLVTFAGSHGRILEYLVEEVLRVQPEPFQEFLLQTTFLSRLTGSLCDAVTGRTGSAGLLEQLERANLFLLPLDGAQQWYRYHPLFAEAMQHYAQHRLGEVRLYDLYKQASRWYEQYGFLNDAIETSLSARDFSRAAGLMERTVTPQPVVNNEYHTQRRWLEQLPQEVLQTRPTLNFTYAVAILFTSDQRAPATMALLKGPLELAEQQWRAEDNRPKLGQVLGFRALATWWQGAFSQAFAAARQGLELIPGEDVFWRGLCLLGVGAEEGLAGRLKAARQILLEARAHLEAAGDRYTALSATCTPGEVCARQGELHQAVCISELHRRAAAWYEQNNWVDEGVTHAVVAQDVPRMVRLFERRAHPLIMQGEIAKPLCWLAALPAEQSSLIPRLALVMAWAQLLAGNFGAIEPALEQAALALAPIEEGSPLEAAPITVKSMRFGPLPLSNRSRPGRTSSSIA